MMPLEHIYQWTIGCQKVGNLFWLVVLEEEEQDVALW